MQADDGTAKRHETRSRIDHRTGKRVFIHDASFWRTHVEERARLGQSVHAYCMERGLALSTFRRWAQRLQGREKAPARERGGAKVAFLEVPIERARHEAAALSPIEVSLGPAVRIRLEGEAAVRVLRLVLARVERAAQS
jgi:hypothetical protein